jgi:peptidoglycan/LPS O-acetylase OafA/YrhL
VSLQSVEGKAPAIGARSGSVQGVRPAPSRVLQLDILRGFAILAVLGMHSPGTRGESGLLRPFDSFIHRFGWTGVDLFFVLSGYLIGGLLFAEIRARGEFDLRRFFIRRFLRIWPPYYTLVAYVFIRLSLDPAVGVHGAWSSMWPAVVNIQNFILSPRDHLWSLAVEEHFYFLMPLFLWLVTRNEKSRTAIPAVPIACLVVCVASHLLRTVLALTLGDTGRTQTYMCIDGLFFGVNLAYLKAYRPELLSVVTSRKWTFYLGFLLLAPALSRSAVMLGVISYTSVYLGYALLLVHFVHIKPGEGLLGRWMLSRSARLIAAVGLHSYSIYLWHRDTGWLGYDLSLALMARLHLPGELRWLFDTLAFVVAAIVGGAILDRLIEQPVQRVRARLFPPRATVPVEGTAIQTALEGARP